MLERLLVEHVTYGELPLRQREAGLAPHCMTDRGEVWFENVDSMAEKLPIARVHRLGGVTCWNLSGEPADFFNAVLRYYP